MAGTGNSPILVRDAQPTDHATVVDFNQRLALETEHKRLDEACLAAGVRTALAQTDRLHYWIAEQAGKPIGQAAVSREWSDWRNGWIWWFQSVYVVPEARRLGVFRTLWTHIREVARRQPDVVGLRLYVETSNDRAIQTYRKLGFHDARYQVLEQFWEHPDAAGTGEGP